MYPPYVKLWQKYIYFLSVNVSLFITFIRQEQELMHSYVRFIHKGYMTGLLDLSPEYRLTFRVFRKVTKGVKVQNIVEGHGGRNHDYGVVYQ